MEFDEKYKVYRWYHWMNLHWIINPGLAVNELLLGQRIPKTRVEDQTSDEARAARSYIPCPHCGKKHKSLTWSAKNDTAFKNWFGLYCPNCGNTIPCLTNLTTLLILTVTFPIWGWFRKSIRAKWFEKQPERFKNLNLDYSGKSCSKYGWIKSGLRWGGFMFVFMTFVFPLIEGEAITWNRILVGLPIWTLAGLGWGFFMKWYLSRQGNKQTVNRGQG